MGSFSDSLDNWLCRALVIESDIFVLESRIWGRCGEVLVRGVLIISSCLDICLSINDIGAPWSIDPPIESYPQDYGAESSSFKDGLDLLGLDTRRVRLAIQSQDC